MGFFYSGYKAPWILAPLFISTPALLKPLTTMCKPRVYKHLW